jgi:methionyl-tRNA synthetase
MVFGHGWWISEGQKMSKSLGNFIDLERMRAYAGRYGLDALRWYLVTQGPLSGSDADFSHAKFVEVYNADLANGIGNCASRVGNMIDKYFGGKTPDAQGVLTFEGSNGDAHSAFNWPNIVGAGKKSALAASERLELGHLVGAGAQLVREVDRYINVRTPFKLAKTVETNPKAKDELAAILYQCAEALRIASLFLSPAMPGKMGQLWAAWGCAPAAGVPLEELAVFGGTHALKPGQAVGKGEALFMRADPAEPAPGATPAPAAPSGR